MRNNEERIIKSMISTQVNKVKNCTSAIVIEVDDLINGFITVQPLINYVGDNLDTVENPLIYNVPVIMPSTTTCGMVLPVNVGDTVLIVYSNRDLDDFKFGNKNTHDPKDFRLNEMEDVVAYVGFNTTQDSAWNPANHSNGHSIDSVKVYNNKGTGSENYVELKSSGDVVVKSPTLIDADAPMVNANDVIINGVGSVKQFMLTHTHNYTDDGKPMVANKPNI